MTGTSMAGTPTTAAVPASRSAAGDSPGTGTGHRPDAPGGPANRWSLLVVLCVSLLFVALDATVLHVAVPSLLTGAFLVLGFGVQTSLFGAYESMLDDAPAERAGAAAGIGETSYQLGAGMGIALLGSVMNAAYAPGVHRVPGVPGAAREAAGRSLGEAYAAADALGKPTGDALREAAQHSFVHGLHITLVVSAALLMLGALAALRLPRAASSA